MVANFFILFFTSFCFGESVTLYQEIDKKFQFGNSTIYQFTFSKPKGQRSEIRLTSEEKNEIKRNIQIVFEEKCSELFSVEEKNYLANLYKHPIMEKFDKFLGSFNEKYGFNEVNKVLNKRKKISPKKARKNELLDRISTATSVLFGMQFLTKGSSSPSILVFWNF